MGGDVNVGDRQRLPKSLVVAEQKQAVLPERPSYGPSELVPPEWRRRLPIEKVSGIESAVSQELKNRSMRRIGTRLRHHDHLGPGPLPIFRGVRAGEHVA